MQKRASTQPARLLIIHQTPPKPNYLRIKIGRHLQRLGAVGIKNSVYALPSSEQAREDLEGVLREVVKGGGDASLVEANFIEGLSDAQVQEMFRAARDADYQAIADEARALAKQLPRKGAVAEEGGAELRPQLARLQKRIADLATLDFFDARGPEPLERRLPELDHPLANVRSPPPDRT